MESAIYFFYECHIYDQWKEEVDHCLLQTYTYEILAFGYWVKELSQSLQIWTSWEDGGLMELYDYNEMFSIAV